MTRYRVLLAQEAVEDVLRIEDVAIEREPASASCLVRAFPGTA